MMTAFGRHRTRSGVFLHTDSSRHLEYRRPDVAKHSAVVEFEELAEADLLLDAVYRGGEFNDVRDDPLHRLLGVGNQGGFRFRGSVKQDLVRVCVLYSELTDPDWPDELRPESGRFIYYGDNKKPGHELHDTKRSEPPRVYRRAPDWSAATSA